MPIKRLSQSGLLTFAKHSSMLADNAPFNPNSFDLLETTTLTTSASSVTFAGLDSYAADYKHLQIRAVHRFTSNSDNLYLRANGVSTASYSWHFLRTTGSAPTSFGYASQTRIRVGESLASYTTANAYAASVCDVLNFSSSTKNTTFRTLFGMASADPLKVGIDSGAFLSTAAITSLELFSDTNLEANTRISLYGVK